MNKYNKVDPDKWDKIVQRMKDKEKQNNTMLDRFNLEEEIQNVWQTKDDLDAITERMYDDPDGPMTEDEISNVLIGLSELHETRCRKLWKVFETIVNEKLFKDIYYESKT